MNQIELFKFNSINYEEPQFQIKRGKQWLEFGSDNDAYTYIDSLLTMSADHLAIVNGLTQFIVGQGLQKPTDPKALAFYTNGEVNVSNPNNLGEIIKKVGRDLAVYGGALLNVRFRKDGLGIADTNYVDVRTMRPDIDPTSGYWISKDWKQWRKEENTPVFYPSFDASNPKGSQLLYIRIPSAIKSALALPLYWSVREYIEADQELITFHLSRVRNSFQPSTIIQINDPSITDEERDKNYKSLKDFFAGSSNAGKAACIYSDSVKFEKFEPTDVPADYELLQQNINAKIKAGHRVSGEGQLFGLSNEGGGLSFSNEQILHEFEVYSRVVVEPIQKEIVNALQMLASCNGIVQEWTIDPFQLFPEENTTTTGDGTDQAPTETVADTAMNGAQVSSLIEIITSVGTGTISKATAKPLIQAAFPALSPLAIDAMLAGVEEKATATPNPNPILQ